MPPPQNDDPRLPFPPAQRGVPGYDWPDIGGILIREKHSTEIGSYKALDPQTNPVYAEQDANKFPAPLYLTRQELTPDGKWCYRTWANDRTIADQNKWNFDYDFSDQNASYPIIVRTYILPRPVPPTSYAIAALTPDAVVSTAFLTIQKQDELPKDDPRYARSVKVTRVYETLDGPTRQNWIMNAQTQITASVVEQRIKTTEVSEPSPSLGVNVQIKHLSAAVAEITTKTQDNTRMANFFRVFVGTGSIELPKVLLALQLYWSTSTAAGTYSESGSGVATGVSASLSLTAQGRGQGSASVLPELVPVWAPHNTTNLPFVEFWFFLPDNATEPEVLTAASAFATIWLGGATTINAWPVFQPIELPFAIIGQKISVSAEAVARCSVSLIANSLGGLDVSESTSSGTGTSKDIGDSARPVNIQECLCAGIIIPNPSMTESVTCTASAVVASGTNFPGATASTSASGTAFGYCYPASVNPTSPPGLPATGLYGIINSMEFEDGYSAYRVKVFDMNDLQHEPQTTLIDFFGLTGNVFTTGAAGLGFVIYLNNSTVAIGVWIDTGTESQPDFSQYGSIVYQVVNIGNGNPADTVIAGQVNSVLSGGFGSNASWTQVNGAGNTSTAIQVVDAQVGSERQVQPATTYGLIAFTIPQYGF